MGAHHWRQLIHRANPRVNECLNERRSVWRGHALAAVVLVLLGWVAQSSQVVRASVHVAGASTDVSAVGRVAAGDEHTCAINEDDTVWCWGSNASLQLGVTSSLATSTSVPIRSATLPGGRVPEQIVAGSAHTCVRADDGTVWCWGDNGFGQLGNNTAISNSTPQQVTLPVAAIRLAAGGPNTCAVLQSTDLYCWGRNDAGQVGIGSVVTPQTTPQQVAKVPSIFIVNDIEVGDSHTCAVSAAGVAWCWGLYTSGRLGSSGGSNALQPRATAALGGTAASVTAGGAHSCVVLSTHALKCFGSNEFGQIAQGLDTMQTDAPTSVVFGSDVDAVAAGLDFTCGLSTAGAVKCFGRNNRGQLGNGVTDLYRNVDARVVAGLASDRVVTIVAGAQHACAVVDTGAVKCWGQNEYGQIGVNTQNEPQKSATAVGVLDVVPTTTAVATVAPIPSVSDSVGNGTNGNGTNDGGTGATDSSTVPVVTTSGVQSNSPTQPPTQPPTTSTSTSLPVLTTTTLTSANSSATKVAATSQKVVIRALALRRGRSVPATSVASAVSMKVPKTSQGRMRISIVSGGSRCAFRGSVIVGLRTGKCGVAVTLMPKVGKNTTRRTTITVR